MQSDATRRARPVAVRGVFISRASRFRSSPERVTNAASARAVIRRRFRAPLDHHRTDLRPGNSRRRPEKGRRLSAAGAGMRLPPPAGGRWSSYAEPLFELPNEEQFAPPIPPGDAGHDRRVRRRRSARNQLPVESGRAEGPMRGRCSVRGLRAAGVVVGHPDTGYTTHPEIAGPRLRWRRYDSRTAAPTPGTAEGRLLRHPSHGTSTSSLIMSGQSLAAALQAAFVSGTAPGVSLIPIRTTASRGALVDEPPTKAVRYAVAPGAHVISDQPRGPCRARRCTTPCASGRARLIVLCAAGNQVRFVCPRGVRRGDSRGGAAPSTTRPWPGSCRGPPWTITAQVPPCGARARTEERRSAIPGGTGSGTRTRRRHGRGRRAVAVLPRPKRAA